MTDPYEFLRRLFATAAGAADPSISLGRHLPRSTRGRTVIVDAGKAAAAMAHAVEQEWPGEISGAVVTRYGHRAPTKRIEVVEAARAAAEFAERAGVRACILGDAIEDEAREVARVMAPIAKSVATHSAPLSPPCVLLSGGETSVTVCGSGYGGRNVEFLPSLGCELAGHPRIHALACDTDGVDGVDEIAGAILKPDTPVRGASLGLHLRDSLDRNDGHTFFQALGDAVVTGPTLTNVNDFRAILVI
ncbi:MOFRL family protein [Bradyrhizobium sp. UFLA01-814]|uniref:MOFRL family protein n=1 Tax=Bradyrhizobium sp. UFLA01-814 TaxID=3023480 RepID=UPI00398B8711